MRTRNKLKSLTIEDQDKQNRIQQKDCRSKGEGDVKD